MSKYVCNAFSLQMLKSFPAKVTIEEIAAPSKEELLAMDSAVGHPDTAAVIGVECKRVNVSLNAGDEVVVAQLQGGRLPEGSTTLPEGFSFKWLKVTIG